MPHPHPALRASGALLAALLTGLLITAPTPARADTPHQPDDAEKPFSDGPFDDGWQPAAEAEAREAYPDSFNGSFVDLGVRLGQTQAGTSGFDGDTLDLGGRFSFPMYVGDVRLAYRYDNLTNTGAGARGDLNAHSMSASLALHPFYLFLLGSDWLSYTFASIYLDAGLGMQRSTLRQTGRAAETDLGFVWHWGVGIDVPLWDPDVGFAPWLNVLYRNHRATHDRDGVPDIGMPLHTVFLGLSWRINTLVF